MAPHLPESLLPKALEMIDQLQDNSSRSSALSALAPHLPEALLSEMLETVIQIPNKHYCADALQNVLPYLKKISIPFDVWLEILDVLACQKRRRLFYMFSDIRSIPTRSCDRETFLEVIGAVRKVCEQWP